VIEGQKSSLAEAQGGALTSALEDQKIAFEDQQRVLEEGRAAEADRLRQALTDAEERAAAAGRELAASLAAAGEGKDAWRQEMQQQLAQEREKGMVAAAAAEESAQERLAAQVGAWVRGLVGAWTTLKLVALHGARAHTLHSTEQIVKLIHAPKHQAAQHGEAMERAMNAKKLAYRAMLDMKVVMLWY
jgi:hypothetical protein